ncbi:MAG: AI-2E family transporter [Flavobacteriales bacterium]|nr:AI-2E family transporter [Flavobacteriales bacterium]
MNSTNQLPSYARTAFTLVSLYLVFYFIVVLQGILLPIIYAIIAGIVVSPLIEFLLKIGVKRIPAVVITLFLVLIFSVGMLILIIKQATNFSSIIPQIIDKIYVLLENTIEKTSLKLHIEKTSIENWLAELRQNAISNSGSSIGSTFSSISYVLTTLLLTPVYFFMFLVYKPHLIQSIHKIFGASNDENISAIFKETQTIIRQYIVGIFTEMGIVAILNTIGLLILGFDYAILFGLIGGILNIIPYMGALIAMCIYVAIAIATKPPIFVVYVLLLYGLIQFIDNNFLVPKIVGSKVRLNALASFIAVIVGAALCGLQGMFLSIPLLAIGKVILDRFDSTRHYGFLLSVPASASYDHTVHRQYLKNKFVRLMKLPFKTFQSRD